MNAEMVARRFVGGVPDDRYQDYPYRVLYYDGDCDSVTINGRTNNTTEMPTDLIRKIREL